MSYRKNWKKMTAFLMAVIVIASLTSLASAATDSINLVSGGNGASAQTQNSTCTNDCLNQTYTDACNSTCTQNCTQNGNNFNNAECLMPGGLANNTMTQNKTNMTPNSQMEQVRAGEPVLFRYRNMVMLMNCTQNCSLVVSADSAVTPKILGLSIESIENMTVAMNMYGSPMNGEMVAERTLNFYLGIEPNSQQQLKGQIRLYINQTELQQELNREVETSRLTWMFWNTTTTQWQQVPSFIDTNGYLVCNTDHFSTWTVSEIKETSQSLENLVDASNMAIIVAGAVGIIVLVLVAVIFLKKR